MKQAYFCAKVRNVKVDPSRAIQLAKEMGLKLWIPANRAECGYPKGALKCKKAIDNSQIVICQPPIGRDCAWELGYAVGLGKPIYVTGKLDKEDWMTKININYVK